MSTFEFKKRLGSGYFGEVWQVTDTGLGADFALKCIPKDKVINPDNFYQEAQILKAAEHPNIVKVFETGDLIDGRIYVKMEYLKYGSLEDEASGAYVHLTRVKKLMVDMLRGLEHAHSKSIVHRDIKPANIMIGDAKEGKLSDFGLALPDLKSIDISIVKKYQYWLHVAPEVNTIADYSNLSDIYASGITLYRLVNGDSYLPPIPIPELRLKAKEGKFPDRKKYRDFIPISLKRVINKALNVNPAERYQSALELRHALEQVDLGINWNETILPNGYRWRTAVNKHVVEVLRIKNRKGSWSVEVRKGNDLTSLRMINRLCGKDLSPQEAISMSRRILQDFVLGKEK